MGTRVLVILGSGLDSIFNTVESVTETVDTKFGKSQMERIVGSPFVSENIHGSTIFVLKRHGVRDNIAPHLINYDANMAAAKKLKIDFVVSTCSVGSLDRKITKGTFIVLDQFIDFTKNRPSSLYFESRDRFAHTDMTNPYSEKIRNALIRSLSKCRVRKFRSRGIYVCTEGPRYETAAEINMFKKLGGDVVGMTGVPEVVTANEVGIPYGSLAVVTNLGAGLQRIISHEEVELEMNKVLPKMKMILGSAIQELLLS